MKVKNLIVFIVGLQIFPIFALAQTILVDIKNVSERDIEFAGFELKSDQKLKVEALGAGYDDEMFAYAWIIDAQTRKPVWEMTYDNTSRAFGKGSREFNESISLKKGEYEVYYSAGRFYHINIKDFDDITGLIFEGRWKKKFKHSGDWGIKITGSGQPFTKDAVLNYQKARNEQAIIQFIKVQDSEYFQKGFSLEKPMVAHIYALGEGTDEMYDFGWITNAKTGERIWEMTKRNSEHAGGAEKNYVFDGNVSIPAGDYIVYYVTDDSHSYEDWNSPPPFDPNYWGITITPEKDFDKKYFKDFNPKKGKIIVDITRIGDDEFKKDGFSLDKPARIHIYSIGEYDGHSGEMADYGWIENVDTKEKIWEMEKRNTEHAGGARKNRMFNGTLTLKQGNYMVYYLTDDSHSYRSWNDSPPFDKENWGIVINCADEDCEKSNIKKYREEEDKTVLVKLIRMRDEEHAKISFTLDKTTQIYIYALGEGDEDEMFDYGWIENADTKEKVWKMRYYETTRAGGAKKNRKFEGTITLPKGNYIVHYVTDDSHSYRDWNSPPPRDPENWGITIKVKE